MGHSLIQSCNYEEGLMKLPMMWLYDNDDDKNHNSNDDNDNDDDNENDMNDDDEDGDDDDDPYKKVLVEVNKPSFNTTSNIIMCSIIVISYACLRL